MPPKDEDEGGGSYGPHMGTLALTILVMGASIGIVILLWVWFGHIGAPYSFNRLLDQQKELRDQYGLAQEKAVPKEMLEVPPSLRNLTTTTTLSAANETTTK